MMKKNYIASNLRYLRENKGVEQLQIAELLGKKSTSAVSEWEKGVRVPNVGDLHDLSIYFGITLDDLINIDLKDSKIINNNDFETSTYNQYKYFPVSISAGALEDVDGIMDYDLISLSDQILGKYAGRKDIIILKINGESMNEVIPDGSFILVDTSKTTVMDLNSKDIVVFTNNGEGYSVKRYINDTENQRFIFKPESTIDTYTPIIIDYEESSSLKVVGRVVKYIVDLD